MQGANHEKYKAQVLLDKEYRVKHKMRMILHDVWEREACVL